MSTSDGDEADIGYVDALAELEAILDELDDESMDIDVLSDRVERAATLIKICRGRIVVARDRVTSIVAELDEFSITPDPDADTPSEE